MSWMPDYTDVATLRAYCRGGLDQDQDAFWQSWITAASRNVDDLCSRQFGNTGTVQTRTYSGVYDNSLRQWVYEIDDIQDVTGMIVAVDAQVQTSYVLWPRNAPARGKPYTQLRATGFSGDITATGIWGWTAVPPAVPAAVWLQGARLAKRRDSPFGIAGSPTDGSELRLLAKLDADLQTSLQPLVRDWWAA